MTEHSLTISQLQKSYGHTTILQQLDLTLHTGEFVGLVGGNGTGKTTLINCILDFCSINGGNITIFGIDHRQTSARQNLVYLPEKFNPPYYMTGKDYLDFMSELHNTHYSDNEIASCLTALELDQSALKKPVRQYSKGMGQKLGLLACFLANKKLMIFDEPMSGLDPRARSLLRGHLLKLKGQGKTLFYSTHLLEDVETICDRVMVLHDGKIRFSGTTDECCQLYNVKSFESAYLACTK